MFSLAWHGRHCAPACSQRHRHPLRSGALVGLEAAGRRILRVAGFKRSSGLGDLCHASQ